MTLADRDDSTGLAPQAREVTARMIRPLATGLISGITEHDGQLLVLDSRSGRICTVDRISDNTCVVNDATCAQFVGAAGLALGMGQLWSATGAGVCAWPLPEAGVGPQGPATVFAPGPDAQGVACYDGLVYSVHGESPRIEVRDAAGQLLWTRPVHGIGTKSISATAEHLWIVDRAEQTAYCLSRADGHELYRAITPQEQPTAIHAGVDGILVGYYCDEPYIADDPWATPNWVLRYRDRTLIAPLHVAQDGGGHRTYSTGYRVAMEYFVEIAPDDDREYDDVRWRIGLPLQTARQRVLRVSPVGVPFTEVLVEDQPMAQFELGRIGPGSRLLAGWRAELELFSVKYQLDPQMYGDTELPDGFAAKYLVDDYDLAMAAPSVIAAAREAAGDATDPITMAHRIRNWVYDHVDYEMGNADDPEGVLARGTGSCGEYVGVLMALTRLSGLASRAAGRYKVPYAPWTRGEPLYPDFNHAWLDLFVPRFGWVPIESNPDDTDDGGPYPDRFFLGLPWRHIELTKDISFETVTHSRGGHRRRASAGRLSRNHIRFQILAEIAPQL